MLSLGTEFFFAFWMASNSVGLPAGSPPPVRAATSTFLISRAKSLPRRASTTAFLCLVVAHLEWPDIASPFYPSVRAPHHLHEEAMDPKIPGELRVEGGSEHVCLPNRHNPTGGRTVGDPPQDLDTGADPLDPRGPDEHGMKGAA